MQSNPKTRLQALLEVLPNIERDDDGYPRYCVEIYDKAYEMKNNYDCGNGCAKCKKRFWEGKIEHGTEIDITDNAEKPNDSEKILAALNDIYARLEQLETLIRISNPINVTGTTSGTIKPKNTQEIIITV